MAEPIFFGTKSDKLVFDKENNIHEIPDEAPVQKENSEPERQRTRIDLDTLEPMSKELLDNINKTWLRHDPLTVWMQSDLSFYDEFYMEDHDINDPLTAAARSIRRTYRNYPEYRYACEVREKYIERIFLEQYHGNEILFTSALRGGLIGWIPPMPNYSKSSSDYARYKDGMVDVIDLEVDEEESSKLIKEVFDEFENTADDVEMDVLTDLQFIRELEDADEAYQKQNNIASVRNMDLRNFKDVIRSWYTPTSSKETEDTPDQRLFSKTPEGIRQAYYDSFKIDLSWMSKAMAEGTLDEIDMNELVFDDRTGKPMTRAEKAKRDMLRYAESYGWKTLPVMKALNIGSSSERKEVALREKARSKNRLKANAIMDNEMSTMYGSSPSSLESDGYEEYMNRYFGGSE